MVVDQFQQVGLQGGLAVRVECAEGLVSRAVEVAEDLDEVLRRAVAEVEELLGRADFARAGVEEGFEVGARPRPQDAR